jgi:hypothetical protein
MQKLSVNILGEDLKKSDCCPGNVENKGGEDFSAPPMDDRAEADEPCCGPKPGPPSSPYARPGFRLCHFVADFIETGVGPVPRIETALRSQDLAGTVRARLGISRSNYRIAPGLYAAGHPKGAGPVLLTANYKLSFDSLRRELTAVDAWILVLDTRGVNVWCAAGKRTFSADEVIRQVKRSGLDRVVSHRELILPQLAAPGVSAGEVKKGCGYKVIWGPIRAGDLPAFLQKGCRVEPEMRRITFSVGERIILVPVELSLILRPTLIILLGLFLLSGIGPDIFSFSAAWFRGLHGAGAYLLGVLAGAVIVPVMLPWLPSRRFYIKGIFTGLAAGVLIFLLPGGAGTRLESLALILLATAVSSYAAMNFTGATPFTSPSGVEKEMRQGIPLQVVVVAAAAVAWVAAPFAG